MSGGSNRPIIIKRKKVVAGGGHHGGAWKVAYADFVTAMMAFFMLMWLLNATTETQRKGIADYFTPTIPVNRISGGGDGSFGGDSIFAENTLARNGTGASMRVPTEEDASRGATGTREADQAEAEEAAALAEVETALSALSGESMVSEQALRHIVTRVTDEGLIVEIFDLPGEPLFAPGSAAPTPVMSELTTMLAEVFSLVRNAVAVNGHVRAEPVVLRDSPVWDLSTDRADATRELVEAAGLAPARLARVTGFADRTPVTANPMAERNNRIELILLRSERR